MLSVFRRTFPETALGIHTAYHRKESSWSQSNDSGVFELRTYSLYPDKVAEFLKLTGEEFHLRTTHSKLLGYWTAEIGGLNQVVHMWYYDSLEHRAAVRKALANDQEWLGRYISKAIKMWSQQENVALKMLDKTKFIEPSVPGFYELRVFHMNQEQSRWTGLIQQYVQNEQAAENNERQIVGAWKTVIGDLCNVIFIRHLRHIDDVLQLPPLEDALFNQHVLRATSKLLQPVNISPLK